MDQLISSIYKLIACLQIASFREIEPVAIEPLIEKIESYLTTTRSNESVILRMRLAIAFLDETLVTHPIYSDKQPHKTLSIRLFSDYSSGNIISELNTYIEAHRGIESTNLISDGYLALSLGFKGEFYYDEISLIQLTAFYLNQLTLKNLPYRITPYTSPIKYHCVKLVAYALGLLCISSYVYANTAEYQTYHAVMKYEQQVITI